ncbi:MAG TPA: hypothetical protein VLJ37_07340 [bacterium]|nr:hypothetical protein [bacterium]
MKKTTAKRILVLAGCLLLGASGILLPPRNAEAATLAEILQQIDADRAAGEIKDANLADALHHMIYDAQFRSGDAAAQDDILEAFKDTVSSNSGDLITAAAATRLLGMAP